MSPLAPDHAPAIMHAGRDVPARIGRRLPRGHQARAGALRSPQIQQASR